MNRYLIAIAAAAIVGSGMAEARQLTAEEALARVAQQQSQSAGVPARQLASRVTANAPRYTLSTSDGALNTLYVLSPASGEGYLIVSADDVATPLLAYSDSQSFDPTSIPPALEEWMQWRSAEIAYLATTDGRCSAPARASYAPVSPLLTTTWDQGDPYNADCPTVADQLTPTGCGATAAAQIMKRWAYPATGQGSNSYSWTYSSTSYSQSMNFADVTFDWDNMLNSYSASYTDEQKQAVATLMHASGVSMDMSYTPGASGATITNTAKGLYNYFNYDCGLWIANREFYTDGQWTSLIYNELSAGRPVFYTGFNDGGGHAFVADGYSNDGFFHINWGWGGASNGYYLLWNLTPGSQGIGGSAGGYNAGQAVILGVRPPVEGSVTVGHMVGTGSFGTSQSSYNRSSNVHCQFKFTKSDSSTGMTYLSSFFSKTVTLGVKLTDDAGNVQYLSSSITDYPLDPYTGFAAFSVTSTLFPVGTFTVTPAACIDGEWSDMLISLDLSRAVSAEVTSNKITFTPIANDVTITVTDVELLTPVYSDTDCSFSATFESTGEYIGSLTPLLYSGATLMASGEAADATLTPDEARKFTWICSFGSIAEGDYQLAFTDKGGNVIDAGTTVTVGTKPSGDVAIATANIAFPTASGSGTTSNPYIINPHDMTVTFDLKCTSGYWIDTVEGMLFDPVTHYSVASFGSTLVYISSGETKNITLTGDAGSLSDGGIYWFTLWGANKGQMCNVRFVKVENPTVGIEDVATDTDAAITLYPNPATDHFTVKGLEGTANVNIYSLAGSLLLSTSTSAGEAVSISALAPGHYVVVVDAADGSRSVERLLVK